MPNKANNENKTPKQTRARGLTRPQIVTALAEETGMTKKSVTRLLEAFFAAVESEVARGGRVKLSGFGTFLLGRRAERRGINPATKESLQLPATVTPQFRAGTGFKSTVRRGRR